MIGYSWLRYSHVNEELNVWGEKEKPDMQDELKSKKAVLYIQSVGWLH